MLNSKSPKKRFSKATTKDFDNFVSEYKLKTGKDILINGKKASAEEYFKRACELERTFKERMG